MIPLFRVKMSDAASGAVSNVLASGFIGQGPVVEQFEDKLWQELESKTRPVTVNSCTAAIDLALELLGVENGDEIITTPQTCFASNVGAIHRGARIRWADIDPLTGLIQPASVEKLITNRTKAVIAVNWAGQFCNFTELKKLGIPVIEDAAHVWDVFVKDRPKLERGDYICYSFQAIKFLTCGDGGALVCPEETQDEAKILRWYGLDRTKNESFRCTQNITRVGFKYHMNDINASIGLSNIPAAADSVNASRDNSHRFIERVINTNFVLPTWDETSSYWLFSMHVLSDEKEHFSKYLAGNGIVSSPVHFRNDLYDSTIHFQEDKLPGVDAFTSTQICIPNGWWLSAQDSEHIITILNNYNPASRV